MYFMKFSLNILLATDIIPFLDVLKYKSINNVINVNCDTERNLLWHKFFNYNYVKVTTLSGKKINQELPNFQKIAVILNTSCSEWNKILDFFPPTTAFKSPYSWLIFTKDLNTTESFLYKQEIEIDSDVLVILKKQNIYDIYEAFHKNYSCGELVVRKIGCWNKKLYINQLVKRSVTGLVIRSPVVVSDRIVNETFIEYLSTPRKNKVDSLHKLKFFALLNYIGDMFNFSYDFQRTTSWGYVRNGTFDGIVGSLQRNDADVGGSPLFFRGDRSFLIDYIAEAWTSRQCFILRHPKHPGGFYTIYTRPLTAYVWYCILCVLAVSGIILCIMLKVKIPRSRDGPIDSSFSLAFLFVWSALCQQGMTLSKNSTSVKVVIIVTFVYAVTLYQYYNATVVSTLLREPPKNIRTLEDLYKSNLKLGAEDVLYTKDYFKRTTDPVAIKIYRNKLTSDRQSHFYSAENGMKLVKQGGFAFHVDSVVAYRIMRSTFAEREICEAHEVLLYQPQKMGLVVRKLSPYKEYFTYGIRKMFESGLMYRLREVWDEPKPECVHTPDTSIFSVSIREFSTALLSLTAGIITSLIVLIGEIVLDKLH